MSTIASEQLEINLESIADELGALILPWKDQYISQSDEPEISVNPYGTPQQVFLPQISGNLYGNPLQAFLPQISPNFYGNPQHVFTSEISANLYGNPQEEFTPENSVKLYGNPVKVSAPQPDLVGSIICPDLYIQSGSQYLSSFNKLDLKAKSAPLISNIAAPKSNSIYGKNAKSSNPNVPVGLGPDGKEINPVLRLFTLFYQLHYYINDVLPSAHALNSVHYISLVPPVQKYMPATMNVQIQVVQAVRQCTIFLSNLERITNGNKAYDLSMYEECENALILLRGVLRQLSVFRYKHMQHRNGYFVTEEGRVQAMHLERILNRINRHIREANIAVHIFDWAMSMQYNKPPLRAPLDIPAYQRELIESETHLNGQTVGVPVGYERADLLVNIIKEVHEELLLGNVASNSSTHVESASADFILRDLLRNIA